MGVVIFQLRGLSCQLSGRITHCIHERQIRSARSSTKFHVPHQCHFCGQFLCKSAFVNPKTRVSRGQASVADAGQRQEPDHLIFWSVDKVHSVAPSVAIFQCKIAVDYLNFLKVHEETSKHAAVDGACLLKVPVRSTLIGLTL